MYGFRGFTYYTDEMLKGGYRPPLERLTTHAHLNDRTTGFHHYR
jgi:hypothetical protein